MSEVFEHRIEVHADGEVIWGPDPVDVAAVVDAIAPHLPPYPHGASREQLAAAARAALTVMHERQGQG